MYTHESDWGFWLREYAIDRAAELKRKEHDASDPQ